MPWNVHQPQYDEFDFEGQNDLVRFIKLADDIGLLVILRAGPYICGEWEYVRMHAHTHTTHTHTHTHTYIYTHKVLPIVTLTYL